MMIKLHQVCFFVLQVKSVLKSYAFPDAITPGGFFEGHVKKLRDGVSFNHE